MIAHGIDLTHDGDRFVLTVSGAFDAETVFDIRGRMNSEALGDGCTLIVDLSGTEFMDSAGIGFIVGLARRASREGWAFEATGATGQVQRLLQRVGWPTMLAS